MWFIVQCAPSKYIFTFWISLNVNLEDRIITEAEKWEMRDLEAKHPSLKRGGEFSPSCRARYITEAVVGDEGSRGQASQPQERGRVQPLLQDQV
jgi:hypothetical protein